MKKVILAVIAIGAIIFGINYFKNNSSSKTENFELLLKYVPKDTSYLFGNKKPIPEEFRVRQATSLERVLESVEKTKPKTEETAKTNKFLRKLLKSYREGNFESFAFVKDRSNIIYGFNNYPVIRTQITSPSKFIDSINKLTKDMSNPIEWKDCSGYKCIQEDINKDLSITLIVKSNTLALALYPTNKRDKYLKHLIDEPDSKNSYSIDSFNKLLSDNNFKGYSDGFINLKSIANFLTSLRMNDRKSSNAEINCMIPMVNDFTDAVDKIIIGYKALDKDNIESEMIIHTNKNISNTLKSIVSKNSITKVVQDPLFSIRFRLDAKNLSNAIMSLTNYIVDKAKKYNCSLINRQKLLKNTSSLSFMLSIFGSQLSEIYFGIDKIELNSKNGKPEQFGALIEVDSANPTAIIGMLKAKSPIFANIDFPQDGTQVDLLKSLPKPSPKFIKSITTSLKENIITLNININKSQIREFKDNKQTLLWMNINNNKFLTFLVDSSKFETQKQITLIEKFKKMGILKEDEYKRRGKER